MLLEVHVRPNTGRDEITEILNDHAIKVRVRAPAKEGKANKAVIALVADALDIPKTCVNIKHGLTGRVKLLEISGLTMPEMILKLEEILK